VSVDVPHYVVVDNIDNSLTRIHDPFFGVWHCYNRKLEAQNHQHPNFRWRVDAKEFKDTPYDFGNIYEVDSFIAIKSKLLNKNI